MTYQSFEVVSHAEWVLMDAECRPISSTQTQPGEKELRLVACHAATMKGMKTGDNDKQQPLERRAREIDTSSGKGEGGVRNRPW